VIVHHPTACHERVANCRSDEVETAQAKALLIASDSAVRAGIPFIDLRALTIGFPPTNRQMYAFEAVNSR